MRLWSCRYHFFSKKLARHEILAVEGLGFLLSHTVKESGGGNNAVLILEMVLIFN